MESSKVFFVALLCFSPVFFSSLTLVKLTERVNHVARRRRSAGSVAWNFEDATLNTMPVNGGKMLMPLTEGAERKSKS